MPPQIMSPFETTTKEKQNETDASDVGSVAVKAPPHWAKVLPTDDMVSVAEQ